MAAFGLCRLSRGLVLSRGVSGSLLGRAAPVPALLQKQAISLSSPLNKRILGPEEPHEKHDEVNTWKGERVAAVALIPTIPLAVITPHPALDMALSVALIMHCHWRLSGVAEDYIHGQVLPRIHQPGVLVLSILAFAGLCWFNYADIGIGNAVRLLYSSL